MHSFLQNHSRLIVCVLIVISTAAVYGRIAGHNFIGCDDPDYVIKNKHVNSGLTGRGIVWAFTRSHSHNWHPVTWISHMLDCRIYGLNPTGHHLTSLLIHIVNSVLLFLLLTRMTGYVWRSAFVAALFALHPLHVESVAWVAERKDVLSTFFLIITIWAYARYAERPGIGRYLLVMGFFALGLMSKPMLVSLPIILLLLDFWPLARDRSPILIWEKVPLLLLSAGSCAVTFIVQERSGGVKSLDAYPLGVRAANALVAYVTYLWKTIWPTNLAMPYPHPGASLPAWQVVVAGLLLILITAGAIRSAKRRPYLTVGWLWYLITLVPVIGLVQVGAQAMADRYTYVPLIGIFIAIAWGIPEALPRPAPKPRKKRKAPEQPQMNAPLVWSALAVLGIMAILTNSQAGYWRDTYTLYSHALSCTKDNYIAHVSLGAALRGRGEVEEAVEHYREAARINPRDYGAQLSLGIGLVETGHVDEGIARLRKTLAIKPNDALAHGNLAIALYLKGDYAQSQREARLCERAGGKPSPQFLDLLRQKMPEPQR